MLGRGLSYGGRDRGELDRGTLSHASPTGGGSTVSGMSAVPVL